MKMNGRVLIKRLGKIQDKQCEVRIVDQRGHDFSELLLPSCVNHMQELDNEGFLGIVYHFD